MERAERRNAYYSYTLPVGAGARGVPHLRHRLAAPGRLTAMCHDRRTNAGNLQFSFALIDRTVAGKAFALAKQDCISNQGDRIFISYLLFPFSTLPTFGFLFQRVFAQRYPKISPYFSSIQLANVFSISKLTDKIKKYISCLDRKWRGQACKFTANCESTHYGEISGSPRGMRRGNAMKSGRQGLL